MSDKERKLSIDIHVEKDRDLPESAWNVAEFILILQEQIGEWDLDVQVGVNPIVEPQPTTEETPYIGFVKTDELSVDELEEEEIEEEYEDDDV